MSDPQTTKMTLTGNFIPRKENRTEKAKCFITRSEIIGLFVSAGSLLTAATTMGMSKGLCAGLAAGAVIVGGWVWDSKKAKEKNFSIADRGYGSKRGVTVSDVPHRTIHRPVYIETAPGFNSEETRSYWHRVAQTEKETSKKNLAGAVAATTFICVLADPETVTQAAKTAFLFGATFAPFVSDTAFRLCRWQKVSQGKWPVVEGSPFTTPDEPENKNPTSDGATLSCP